MQHHQHLLNSTVPSFVLQPNLSLRLFFKHLSHTRITLLDHAHKLVLQVLQTKKLISASVLPNQTAKRNKEKKEGFFKKRSLWRVVQDWFLHLRESNVTAKLLTFVGVHLVMTRASPPNRPRSSRAPLSA
jgi:hypothetical protein